MTFSLSFSPTVPEFEMLVKQEETYEPWHDMYIINGQCYDHIWVAALALNCTDAYLKVNGEFIISTCTPSGHMTSK